MAERVAFELALPAGWVELNGSAVADAVAASAEEPVLAAELARALEQAERQGRPGRVRYVYVGTEGVPSVRAWAHLELAARDGATPDELLARVQGEVTVPGWTPTPGGGAGTAAATGSPASGAPSPGGSGTGSSGVRPWRREVAAARLAGLPAVVVDDLLEVPSAAGPRVHRRILVTLFPGVPSAPDAPGTSSSPGESNVPGVPGAPGASDASTAPGAPGAPGADEGTGIGDPGASDSVVQFQLSTPDLLAFDDPLTVALELAGSLRLTIGAVDAA
ncbi:hypothetical protein [Herbiconiux sp. UC225_62]|uniref:hypothetical protein n=1 Tax=Herbiconiux sp. UC225_62 TaxID=3350168 RepID=UPI0036D3E43E